MAFDFYTEIERLQEEFIESGRAALAQPLQDSVSGGSTGTEILMAVRWNLGQMWQNNELPEGIAPRVETLLTEIDRTLGV